MIRRRPEPSPTREHIDPFAVYEVIEGTKLWYELRYEREDENHWELYRGKVIDQFSTLRAARRKRDELNKATFDRENRTERLIP